MNDVPSAAVGTVPIKPDQTQLPTPEAMQDQTSYHVRPTDGSTQLDTQQILEGFPQPPSSIVNVSLPEVDYHFSDFLRGVMFPDEDANFTREGLAVLDFCDNANVELNDIDFGILNTFNSGVYGAVTGSHGGGPQISPTTDMSKIRTQLVDIWTNSPWRWDPKRQDSSTGEQGNLLKVAVSDLGVDRVVQEKLEQSGRDKILSIVLSTCSSEKGMLSRIATSFPSLDVMDSLIHIFLASHLCQVSEFIDFGCLNLSEQCPEWLACAASAGAVLAPSSTLRKFGLALQEAVRKLLPSHNTV
jgi:hypothetical protein